MPFVRSLPPPSLARHPSGRRELIAWALTLLALGAILHQPSVLKQPNRLIQDAIVAGLFRSQEEAPRDIVIVAVDDASIAELGRWPWRRTLHAALIDRISKDGPRAIGLDILFTESSIDSPGEDDVLAASLRRSGRVVLPLMMQNQGGEPVAVTPVEALVRSAHGLGHTHLPVDDDGVARSVYLREGLPAQTWSHFSVALLSAAGAYPETKDPPGSPQLEAGLFDPMSGQWLAWQRSHKMRVPFSGVPRHFQRLSYVDVLDGLVASGTFKDKYVLVGGAAAGLGDLYATPVSQDSSKLMPGVEICANVLNSLLHHREVAEAPAWLNLLFNAAPGFVAVLGLLLLGPRGALLLVAALVAAVPLATNAAAMFTGILFAPAAGILIPILIYAMWMMRSLDVASRYLIAESQWLSTNKRIVPLPAVAPPRRLSETFVDRRIQAMRQAAQQLRDLHQFVNDSLKDLPDATFVCDRQGTVLLANAAAARYCSKASAHALQGKPLPVLLQAVEALDPPRPALSVDTFRGAAETWTIAARDRQGRDLQIKCAPSFGAEGLHTGWLLSLVDVTAIRLAQRQRDEAMHFLSHDIRAPQSSILALVALRRQSSHTMSEAQFCERIERHAQKALDLSDDFIHLVRAESQHFHLEQRDLADMLRECIDDSWETSQRRQIRLVMAPSQPEEAPSMVNHALVSRAISNLLGNALKFSPAHTTITCAIEPHADHWAVLVHDQGPGIAPAMQAAIFEPFSRERTSVRFDGAGLGLAFVRAVATRHGGKILLESAPGHGSAFRLVLPRAPETDSGHDGFASTTHPSAPTSDLSNQQKTS